MDLNTAKNIAIAICYKLQPHCEVINLAGSIRRRKEEVKDIEIICVAKRKEVGEPDLFGQGEKKLIVDPQFVEIVNALGPPVKGKPTGKYMQITLPEGINLDLFMPDDFDYYRQYAIRTGTAEYTRRFIAGGWLKKGWCGSDKGLRKIADCIEQKDPQGKSKWTCVRVNGEKPPAWKSEQEFFKWLNIQYLEPHHRNL